MHILIFCFRSCFSKLKKENRRPIFFLEAGKQIWPFYTCIITYTQQVDLLSVLPEKYNHYLTVSVSFQVFIAISQGFRFRR